MQNLFFKKFLLCVIVINSSLVFSMDNELIEISNNNNNQYIINSTLSNRFKKFNSVVNLNQFNNEDIESFLNESKHSKSKNIVFLPNNNEIAELNMQQNNENLVDLNNGQHLKDIKFYSNNLLEDFNNVQFQTLYCTIKHMNKNSNVYKEKEPNNDMLVFVQQLLSMIKDIEEKQKLLFLAQNLNIKNIEFKVNEIAQQIQELKLNNRMQKLNIKEQELIVKQELLNLTRKEYILNKVEQNAKDLIKKEQEWKEKEQELKEEACCSCVIL